MYLALLNPGDTILGMSLDHGGHLTHGAKVNFSGKLFKAVQYGIKADTGEIDYDQVERLAQEHRPKMIVAGILGLFARHRLGALSRHRRLGGRLFVRRHGACGGPGGRRACIRIPCRSPTSSPPPRTRRCAARAAA